jgi:hypothetical protein
MLLIPKRILQSVKKNNTSSVCHVKLITLPDFWRLAHRCPALARTPGRRLPLRQFEKGRRLKSKFQRNDETQ